MLSRTLNIILIIAIAAVIGTIAFFGFRLLQEKEDSPIPPLSEIQQPLQPAGLGKTPSERDGSMEAGVSELNDAVVAYAADHQGKYPESDFKNPCSGVRMCLKGVNINSAEKVYLIKVPQTPGFHLDYYYRADNKTKSYCVQTPTAFETKPTFVFQCTEKGCGTVSVKDACR